MHTFRIFNNKTYYLKIPRVLTLWRIFSLYFSFKFSSRNCSKLGESSKWPQFFSRSISAVRDLISFSCKGKPTFPVSSKERSQDNGKRDRRLTSSLQFSTICGPWWWERALLLIPVVLLISAITRYKIKVCLQRSAGNDGQQRWENNLKVCTAARTNNP